MNIQEMEQKLLAAKRAYYTTGTPIMSDKAYDDLEAQLKQLAPDSIVFTTIGSTFIPDQEKVDNGQRMYSTDKSLSVQEMQPFWNRTAQAQQFVYSQKVDGLAVSLTYVEGHLLQMNTRGDGFKGRVFTSKAAYMPCIPKTLPTPFTGKVRGEMFMTEENFEKLNDILVANNEETQSNARNSTAGLVNSANLQLPEQKLPLLDFRAYGVYEEDSDDYGAYSYYTQQLEKAKELGFTPVEYHTFTRDNMVDPSTLKPWLDSFPYGNDGIVFRVNDQALCRSLGAGKNYLNGVTAFKFEPEKVLVTVKAIEWSVGSRELTPVVVFDPVELDGAVITRASGHSVNNLIALEAVPGSTVCLKRSGGVIPRLYHRNEMMGETEVA